MVELAYWDRGVRAVRAQVGWTRVKTEVGQRDLELSDTTEEATEEQVDLAAEARLNIQVRVPKRDAGSTDATGEAPAPGAPDARRQQLLQRPCSLGAGEALKLGDGQRQTGSRKDESP